MMSQLAVLLRNCTHLRMRKCVVNLFFWKWLLGHCGLTTLDIEDCFLNHDEWKLEEIHFPTTVCILPTPQATLTKLEVKNHSWTQSFLNTLGAKPFRDLNLFANVRQFDFIFDKTEIEIVKPCRPLIMQDLFDFIQSSLPSLSELTLYEGDTVMQRFGSQDFNKRSFELFVIKKKKKKRS